MIITTEQVTVTGDMKFARRVPMGIHSGAYGVVIERLIKLYSNSYLAALREYTANAWDSHKQAGQTRPVLVTLPSKFSSALVIEDFGVGMSGAELDEYGQFGFSTKRDSNEENGAFGLGSKVGLAFSTSYTVTSVKDGKKNVAVVGRDENNAPVLDFLDEVDTDLPNGVKITIPTSETYQFERALNNNFFIGWKPGSILINDEEPAVSVYTDKFEPIGEYGWLVKDSQVEIGSNAYYGKVLVGPVLYDLNWAEVYPELNHTIRDGFLKNVIVRMEIGSVELTPSREDIRYTPSAREVLKEQIDLLIAEGSKHYAAAIDQASTRRTALALLRSARAEGFKEQKFTWQGEDIEFGVFAKDTIDGIFTKVTIGGNSREGFKARKEAVNYTSTRFNSTKDYEQALDNENYILVTGSSLPEYKEERKTRAHPESWKSVYYARALQEADSAPTPSRYSFLFTHLTADELDPWVLGSFKKTVVASTFVATALEYRKKIMREARESGVKREKSETPVRLAVPTVTGNWYTSDAKLGELDTDHKYILLQNGASTLIDTAREALFNTDTWGSNRSLRDTLKRLHGKGYRFLHATKAMKTAHYADSVTLVNLRDALSVLYAEDVAGITQAQLEASRDRQEGAYDWTRYLLSYTDQITDQDTVDWIMAINDDKIKGLHTLVTNAQRFVSFWGLNVTVPVIPEYAEGELPRGERYPLLNSGSYVSREYREEVINYINWKDSLASA
jgi:Histidine kinase-, DNA gyrase B-, and HSP90-like ATPase